METAVPVNNPIFKTFKTIKEVKNDEEKHVDDYEMIGQLVGDPRFETFKKVIEKRIEAIEALENSIDQKDTVESVGFRFLASRAVISHLGQMINLPYVIQEAEKYSKTK